MMKPLAIALSGTGRGLCTMYNVRLFGIATMNSLVHPIYPSKNGAGVGGNQTSKKEKKKIPNTGVTQMVEVLPHKHGLRV
jgi:hypothetical protein